MPGCSLRLIGFGCAPSRTLARARRTQACRPHTHVRAPGTPCTHGHAHAHRRTLGWAAGGGRGLGESRLDAQTDLCHWALPVTSHRFLLCIAKRVKGVALFPYFRFSFIGLDLWFAGYPWFLQKVFGKPPLNSKPPIQPTILDSS